MTSVNERDDTRSGERGTESARRTTTWIAVGLAVLVLILGGWIVYDTVTQPQAPADVEAVISDFLAAYAAEDEPAMRAVAAEDFVIRYTVWQHSPIDGELRITEVIDDDLEGVINMGFSFDWDNEIDGDYVVSSENPWIVSQPENWYWFNTVYDGNATYVVVDVDGEKKIKSYRGDFYLTYGDAPQPSE